MAQLQQDTAPGEMMQHDECQNEQPPSDAQRSDNLPSDPTHDDAAHNDVTQTDRPPMGTPQEHSQTDKPDPQVALTDESTDTDKPVIASPNGQSLARRKMATIAARLLNIDSAHRATIPWQAINEAPDWLALPDDDFALLQRRLGALVHTSEIRRWMDRPRIAAAKQAVGESWLRALCAGRPVMPLPIREIKPIRETAPDDIASHLRATAGLFLCASIQGGPLRQTIADMLDVGDTGAVNAELANSFIARALS